MTHWILLAALAVALTTAACSQEPGGEATQDVNAAVEGAGNAAPAGEAVSAESVDELNAAIERAEKDRAKQ